MFRCYILSFILDNRSFERSRTTVQSFGTSLTFSNLAILGLSSRDEMQKEKILFVVNFFLPHYQRHLCKMERGRWHNLSMTPRNWERWASQHGTRAENPHGFWQISLLAGKSFSLKQKKKKLQELSPSIIFQRVHQNLTSSPCTVFH